MTKSNTRRGFTLIELLVVVLIIGLLAAIALSQYQMAVMKSRVAAIKPLITALKTAEELYYLENGTYTPDLSVLDIGHSCQFFPENTTGTLVCDSVFVFRILNKWSSGLAKNVITAYYCPGVQVNRTIANCIEHTKDFTYTFYLVHSPYPNRQYCDSRTTFGSKACQALCGAARCNM